MAAKFFTGIPLDGPDPECVLGHGEPLVNAANAARPSPALDHSRPSPVTFLHRNPRATRD